jgi:DNA polymerase
MIAEFNHPLRGGATNVVLPWVAPNPNGLVILTDMPGADDDASGKILTGAAGDLMDKMLAAIEMSRESVSIVPMLFWRTPGGRTPTREEIDLARPFVDRAIEMLNPRLVLTLGSLPATEIGNVQIARDHGKVIDLANGIKLIAMYHPNYILLKPSAKREAWAALQDAQKLLKTV